MIALASLIQIIAEQGVPAALAIWNALRANKKPVNPDTGKTYTFDEIVALAQSGKAMADQGSAIAQGEIDKTQSNALPTEPPIEPPIEPAPEPTPLPATAKKK